MNKSWESMKGNTGNVFRPQNSFGMKNSNFTNRQEASATQNFFNRNTSPNSFMNGATNQSPSFNNQRNSPFNSNGMRRLGQSSQVGTWGRPYTPANHGPNTHSSIMSSKSYKSDKSLLKLRAQDYMSLYSGDITPSNDLKTGLSNYIRQEHMNKDFINPNLLKDLDQSRFNSFSGSGTGFFNKGSNGFGNGNNNQFSGMGRGNTGFGSNNTGNSFFNRDNRSTPSFGNTSNNNRGFGGNNRGFTDPRR